MKVIIGKDKFTGQPAAYGTHAEAVQVGYGNNKRKLSDMIPETANVNNPLATQDFVKQFEARFMGTYTDHNFPSGADDNDWLYLVETDSKGNKTYTRFRWRDGEWIEEMEVQNPNFTDAEWAAIRSGMTAEKTAAHDAKYDKPSTGIPGKDIDKNYTAERDYMAFRAGIVGDANLHSVVTDITSINFDAGYVGTKRPNLEDIGNWEGGDNEAVIFLNAAGQYHAIQVECASGDNWEAISSDTSLVVVSETSSAILENGDILKVGRVGAKTGTCYIYMNSMDYPDMNYMIRVECI